MDSPSLVLGVPMKDAIATPPKQTLLWDVLLHLYYGPTSPCARPLYAFEAQFFHIIIMEERLPIAYSTIHNVKIESVSIRQCEHVI